MEERELVAIIEGEVAASIGGGGAGSSGVTTGGTISSPSQQLASERAMELDYYNSKPLGNEREVESQVVTSDVFDAVESMLPHLLKTFTASDQVVEFDPQGMEDEEAAMQRTEVVNYVFYRQNNGFVKMYEWFKDALLQKNGVVKYWWEEKEEVSEDYYEGLTEGEYLTLMQEEGLEVIEHSAYDDPSAVEQKNQMVQKIQQQAQQNPQAQMMLQQVMQQPVPQMHDLKFKTTKDASKICIETIPPEEFGISAKHKCISIQEAPFVYHRTKMTLSALKEQGCPDSVLNDISGEDSGADTKPETMARNRFIDESTRGTDAETDPSLKEVWVVDCFIRLDYDDDGIAELRHIIMPGKTIWINEPSSHINFAAITPIIMPHRFIGKSIAEAVMDIQFNSSVLLRQMFNNLYLTNNPQKVVLGSAGGTVQADLDRLMTSRVGGILVEYAPNAIRNQEVPFVAGASFPMLEFLASQKEQRTGNTRYNQGTDADSLNKTAHGIALIQQASQQKIDLIARIFAETGVKDLFRGIAYFLSKYSTKAMTLRLRGKWVDIDPRQWKTQYDMTVNVGLGTGNKDAQLVHLAKMNEIQIELMKTGRGYMVTDQNVYNLAKKMGENMGFKHPDLFLTDPAKVQKPPPQPNPDMLKIQQADQESKAKIQSNEKIRQFDAQTSKELEQIKAQTQLAIAQIDAATKQKIAEMQIASDAQIEIYKANQSLQGEEVDLHKKKVELGYEATLLAIKKQVDAVQIADKQKDLQEKEQETESDKNELMDAVSAISDGVKQQVDTVTKKTDELGKGQAELAKAVTLLVTKKPEKTERKHKIVKTGDGYEITSVQQ